MHSRIIAEVPFRIHHQVAVAATRAYHHLHVTPEHVGDKLLVSLGKNREAAFVGRERVV